MDGVGRLFVNGHADNLGACWEMHLEKSSNAVGSTEKDQSSFEALLKERGDVSLGSFLPPDRLCFVSHQNPHQV